MFPCQHDCLGTRPKSDWTITTKPNSRPTTNSHVTRKTKDLYSHANAQNFVHCTVSTRQKCSYFAIDFRFSFCTFLSCSAWNQVSFWSVRFFSLFWFFLPPGTNSTLTTYLLHKSFTLSPYLWLCGRIRSHSRARSPSMCQTAAAPPTQTRLSVTTITNFP